MAIAGGNSVLIDGGTLTQSTLIEEIRIGEGDALGVGDGVLTISSGGIFNTGASIGVAVGSSLTADAGGGLITPGSGIVNVNEGSFVMGAGATLGGLGVGLNGSTGVFNLGDGAGAAVSADRLN